MNVIDLLQREQEKPEVPVLRAGDSVRVHVKVVEGTRERIQVFEGLIIALGGKTGLATTFTVRRLSHNIGVERTFLIHSPRLDRIEVLRHGAVRRAKLFYLRDKVGKRARIRERREPIGGPVMVRRSAAAQHADQETVQNPLQDDAAERAEQAQADHEVAAQAELKEVAAARPESSHE